jgi:hypothetical protein
MRTSLNEIQIIIIIILIYELNALMKKKDKTKKSSVEKSRKINLK